MEYKTILEWFQLAQSQGLEWADKAIKNTSISCRFAKTKTMKDALQSAFLWDAFAEGSHYWFTVWNSIN